MRIRLFTLVIGAISLATAGEASIIFRPNEKVKYVAPGEEELGGLEAIQARAQLRSRNAEERLD